MRDPKMVVCRLPRSHGLMPLYLRCEEVVPGIVLHGDVSRSEMEGDNCFWTISHKMSGRSIISGIWNKPDAIRAAKALNQIQSADAEHSWLTMNREWVDLRLWLHENVPHRERVHWDKLPKRFRTANCPKKGV